MTDNNNGYQRVCDVDDVWEGEMEVFEVDDEDVLIVHTPNGEIRAYNASCPHQDFSLGDGTLEDCILTCSAHLWQFNVVTGISVNPTGSALVSYPVKTEDDAIWVALPNEY